jgi:hypothetical protein
MVKKIYLLLFLLLMVIIFTSCKIQPDENLAVPVTNFTPIPQVNNEEKLDVFVIESWFEKPNTNDKDTILIWARLLKNGTKVSGTVLHASWPDPSAERGIARCDVQSIYNGGVCWIQKNKYPTGEYVPIKLSFEYDGIIYSDETGFIP